VVEQIGHLVQGHELGHERQVLDADADGFRLVGIDDAAERDALPLAEGRLPFEAPGRW
jgi:hypothetical protein